MARLEKHPNLYRFVLGLLALYFIFLGIADFYQNAISTTDESIFRTSPSSFYITKNFPAQLLTQIYNHEPETVTNPDSIFVGDLLISVNEIELTTEDTLNQILQNVKIDSILKFTIFRSTADKFYNFQLLKSAIPDSFCRVIPPSVYIAEITKGGASDFAGLRTGDYIFQLDGQSFDNAFEADRILHKVKSGSTIDYKILRNNQNLTIPVTMANFGINLSGLILFLAGLVYWGTGAFIAINRSNLIAARLTGLSLMTFGFFLMVCIFRHDVPSDLFVKARTITMFASLPFSIAFWSHSKNYFPQTIQKIQSGLWITQIPYAIAFAFSISFALFVFDLFNNYIFLNILFLVMLIFILAYYIFIQIHYRKTSTLEYKKLNRVIFWTGFFAGMSAIILGLILGLSGLKRQMGFIGLPLVFIPLSYLYTIGRYQLLEMNLRIRRDILYIIVFSIWTTILVLILIRILVALPGLQFNIPNIQFTGTSFVIIDEPPPPELQDFSLKFILMLLSIGLTIVTWKIGRTGKQFIERKFHRGHQGYSRAASDIAEVMATKLNIVELSRGISQKIAKLMELKRVAVLIFRDQKECCCHEAFGFDSAKWDDFCLKSGQILIDAIQKFRSESRFSTEYLPEKIKETFLKYGFRHIIPIRFKNKLSGTLLIGEKLSEMPLLVEDLTFLAAVAKQASVAIENSFLHTELAEQERLKHELEIARRIQMASLPQRTPKITGLDIAGISIPATEVGGDYYDYLNGIKHDITIIVGDVSGKGTSAALYMSKIQGILRSLHEFQLTPRELFIRANHVLCKDMEKNSFVTAIGAAIDTKKKSLILARAGHLPLYYFQAKTKEVKLITPKGLGLGLDEADVFISEMEEQVIRYQADDIFLFVTDGVTEAKASHGGEFGEDKLVKTLENNSSLNANAIRDQVVTEVQRFAGDRLQHDDQTVVVVKVR